MPTVDPTTDPDVPTLGTHYYVSADDLRERLSPTAQVGNPGSAAVLEDEQLYDCIVRAQNEVESRLAGRYFVPFDGTPPGQSTPQQIPGIVADIVLDLAAWHATLDYRRSDLVTADDPSRLRANAAEALLGQLVAGQATLIGAAPAATPPTATDVSDPAVVNQGWHVNDLTDPRALRHVPAVSWPAYGNW